MIELGEALGMSAPYYNLVFVAIAVYLFIQLVKTRNDNPRVFTKPWLFILAAVGIFIIEEVFTVLRAAGVFGVARNINGFFELAIIILFIYALLTQKEYLEKDFTNEPTPILGKVTLPNLGLNAKTSEKNKTKK